jgi:hypothetical protein
VLRTLPYAEAWRWRVLLPPQGERFIISDRGLCEFGDLDLRTGKDWPSHGVFFPLGPALGVLGFRHESTLHRRMFRPLDFSERLTLNRGYTALLNGLQGSHLLEQSTVYLNTHLNNGSRT